MIYFSLSEILRGILYSMLCGAVLSLLSVAIDVFFCFFESIASIPKSVIKYSADRKLAIEYCKSKIILKKEENRAAIFVGDLIFALVSGVFISFLFYVSADGELRIYLLIGALAFYVICKKVFGARIFSLLQAVLKFTVKLVSVLFVFVLLPLRLALRKVLYFANKIGFDLKARFRALRNRVNKGKNCAK